MPLSLPLVPAPQSIVIGMSDIIGLNISPFTGQQEVQDWDADMWSAKITWSKIVGRAKAEPLVAVLTALRGSKGTILIGDPLASVPLGVGGGTPVVSGALAAGARQIPVSGLPVSTAGWLKAGDYLQLGAGTATRLYKNLLDVDSDSSGNATLYIWPQIRESASDGTAIVINDCKGTFRMPASARNFQIGAAFIYATEINLIEAL